MTEQNQPIDVEAKPTEALAIRVTGGEVGILRPAGSLDQIAEAFKEYQKVCEKILGKEDYQTYEGKPRKKKSAWRKLATAFNVSTKKVAENIIRDMGGHVLSAQFTMQAFTPSRLWEAVGYCEINEKCCAAARGLDCHKKTWKSHFCCPKGCDGRKHWSHPDHDILSTAQTRATNRAIADLIGCGEVSAEELGEDTVQNLDAENPPGRPVGAPEPHSAVTTPPAASTARPPAQPKLPPTAEACRTKFVRNLDAEKLREKATQYCIDLGWLMPNEALEELPLQYAPISGDQYVAFLAKLTSWSVSGKPEKPYGANPDPELEKNRDVKPGELKAQIEVPRDENVDCNSPSAPWRSFPVPFGKHAGTKLADLDKNVLYGFCANYKPEEFWTNKEGKKVQTKPEKLAKDRKFRAMLNEAAAHYEFKYDELEPDDNPSDGNPADYGD
jgi:hypothetical protein